MTGTPSPSDRRPTVLIAGGSGALPGACARRFEAGGAVVLGGRGDPVGPVPERLDALVAIVSIDPPGPARSLGEAARLSRATTALWTLLEAAHPALDRAGGAAVIVVPGIEASAAGADPVPTVLGAGAAALVRVRAAEWGPRVRINLVAAAGPRPSPLGNGPVIPSEIAEAVYFLAGEGARFITGATLPVDRGAGRYWTMGGVGDERGAPADGADRTPNTK
ncbi:MAG: SDR family oxidoreductase [Thermoplasmata archaeon]